MGKKDYSHITSVGIFGTVYSLFIYLLIKDRTEVDNTFFFFGKGINKNIGNHFANKIYINDSIINNCSIKRFLWKIGLLLKRHILWRFIDNIHIYGHDHLVFSPIIIGQNNLTVIEDGMSNYNKFNDGAPHVSGLRKIIIRLYGQMALEPKFGRSIYADKVIMTGILPVLPELKDKAEIIDVKKLWTTSSESKRDLILKIFNIDPTELEIAQSKTIILLTQPFNEIISEEELIKIYKDALTGYNQEDILIKTHPRDTIDYQIIFKEYHVLQSPVPMELLDLLGLKFNKAITISSNAIFSLPHDTERLILGHECSPTLLKTLGPSTFLQKKP